MTFKTELGSFAEPTKHQEPIDLKDFSKETLMALLNKMALARKVEQFLAEKRKEGIIGGPVHLGAGQEAIAAGVSDNLRNTDRIFSGHRSHSHLMALNPDFYKLFAEVLGKDSGFSKGMGGSMHLWDEQSGFYGAVPIVSGTVPLAVGAAIAAKFQKNNDIALAYLGDGAMEEGVVHESLNLSRVLNAPVLFVVENNFFSSHMHVSMRQPSDFMSRFAVANHIPHKLVDGNDVVAIAKAANELISNSREGQGPGFLEVITFRHYGHVDWREDIDVGVNRSIEDLENWRARDPIKRLSMAMIDKNILIKEELDDLYIHLDKEMENAWDKAVKDPYPDPSSTLDRVYKT